MLKIIIIGNLDVDPIYLMLRSAAYKANDGTETGQDDGN